jgi:hypothetical protein
MACPQISKKKMNIPIGRLGPYRLKTCISESDSIVSHYENRISYHIKA